MIINNTISIAEVQFIEVEDDLELTVTQAGDRIFACRDVVFKSSTGEVFRITCHLSKNEVSRLLELRNGVPDAVIEGLQTVSYTKEAAK